MRPFDIKRALPYVSLSLAATAALFGHELSYWGTITSFLLTTFFCLLSLIWLLILRQLPGHLAWLLLCGPVLPLASIVTFFVIGPAAGIAFAIVGLLALSERACRSYHKLTLDPEKGAQLKTPWYLEARIPLGLLALTAAGSLIETAPISPFNHHRNSEMPLRLSANLHIDQFAAILLIGALVGVYVSHRRALTPWIAWVFLVTATGCGSLWFTNYYAPVDLPREDGAWIRRNLLSMATLLALWTTAASIILHLITRYYLKRLRAKAAVHPAGS
jgi:hypothetical protein